MFLFTLSSAVLIFIDFIVKSLAYNHLSFGKVIVLLPNAVRLLYLKNTGAAFGILKGNQGFLVFFALCVCLYIIYYVQRELPKNRMQLFGLIFLFSGTVGNLLNRICLGGVIDYIDLFGRWPVFNLADIFINIGIILLIISIIRAEKHS